MSMCRTGATSQLNGDPMPIFEITTLQRGLNRLGRPCGDRCIGRAREVSK
jgi:hypothetical protein